MPEYSIDKSVTKEYILENIGEFNPKKFFESYFNTIIVKLIELEKINSYHYSVPTGNSINNSYRILDFYNYYNFCREDTNEKHMFPHRYFFPGEYTAEFGGNKYYCIPEDSLRTSIAYLNMQLIHLLHIEHIIINTHASGYSEYTIYPLGLFCYGKQMKPDWKIEIQGVLGIPKNPTQFQKEYFEKVYNINGLLILGRQLDIRLPKSMQSNRIMFNGTCYQDYNGYYNCELFQSMRKNSHNLNKLVQDTLLNGGILPLDNYNIPTFIGDRIAFVPDYDKKLHLGVVKGATATTVTVEEIMTGVSYRCSRGSFVKV